MQENDEEKFKDHLLSKELNIEPIISGLEKKFYNEIKDTISHYGDVFEKRMKEDDPLLAEYRPLYAEAYKRLRQSNLTQDQIEALKLVLFDISAGIIHSLFVTIDGGTELSSDGKALELVDRRSGKPLTDGALHENLFFVLYD